MFEFIYLSELLSYIFFLTGSTVFYGSNDVRVDMVVIGMHVYNMRYATDDSSNLHLAADNNNFYIGIPPPPSWTPPEGEKNLVRVYKIFP